MNMILHGIEAPNIVHTNTLAEDIRSIQEKDRHDVILANPKSYQHLFLRSHFMKFNPKQQKKWSDY